VRFGLDLFDAMHDRSATERVALLQAILIRRLERTRADVQMLRLQRVIERARGNLRVEDLARHAGLSLRQLQRRFQVATGVSPKVLCRLVRLQTVLGLARNPGTTLGRVAAHAGYADQSHLTREFNLLAGLSPREYFSGSHQLNELFFSGDS
jgi:transcriptional regulator GlxA family with amidase domain